MKRREGEGEEGEQKKKKRCWLLITQLTAPEHHTRLSRHAVLDLLAFSTLFVLDFDTIIFGERTTDGPKKSFSIHRHFATDHEKNRDCLWMKKKGNREKVLK